MEPAFARGDLLFLTRWRNTPYEVGDITVYRVSGLPPSIAGVANNPIVQFPGVEVPIVHRVLENHYRYVHSRYDKQLLMLCPSVSNPMKQKLLTKGDNNPGDDIPLYGGREWLDEKYVLGKVSG